jgi:arabinofuranan 3-O-arabinosyltransferase
VTAGPELEPPSTQLGEQTVGDACAVTEDPPRRRRRFVGYLRPRWRSPGLTPRRYLLPPALLLLAAAFAQRPGKIVSDTKVALALNPSLFLSDALHLWNPTVDSGSIANQSTGYLVPMGPFFLLTHALGIPTATAQRIWLGLLLVVGFWGLVRLADALGLGNRPGRILGGLAYALSPFVLSRIGDNSALFLGDIMLPWVLLPLVRVTYRHFDHDELSEAERAVLRPLSMRRAAALSGVAVLLAGGINATVTLAMLVVPALWLAVMCRGRAAWILRGWWVAAVVCATSWWVVSLQLLGHYGVDFVRYTESAKTTTSVTSLAETVRGNADWLTYLRFEQPSLPAGWTYIGTAAAVTASFVLVAIGLAGLCRLRVPARRFLLLSLAVGVIVIAGAWAAEPHGILAGQWLDALAGPLGALRNVNKFQPLIRLPVALGLANCLPLVATRLVRRRRWRLAFNALTAAVLAGAIVVGAAPLGLSRLYKDGSFSAVPTYWKAASAWLNRTADGTRTLLLPASSDGSYSWGAPGDEPMLWLSKQPWAVRNSIPFGGVNSTRWLDAIERQLGQRSAPNLAATLARAGVGYVLVRNDLPSQPSDLPPSNDEIHTALAYSGLKRVASFGPLVAGRRTGVEAFLKVPPAPGRYPSLEIYALPAAHRVDSYPAGSLAVLSGGPEALPLLASGDALGNRPTVLAADLAAGEEGHDQLPPSLKPSTWIDTDTLTRRDEQFGAIHSGSSYLLAEGQNAAGQSTSPHTRLDVDPSGHQTTAAIRGIKSVTASNYGYALTVAPSASPAAAVDNDPTTAWSVSGFADRGIGQWLQVTYDEPKDTGYVSVRLLADKAERIRITSVRVSTDAGSSIVQLRDTEKPQRIELPPGATSTVRLTIASVAGGSAKQTFYGPGIRELTIPGVTVAQSVLLPDDAEKYFPADGADTIVYEFSRDREDPHALLDLDVEREITREFTLPRAADLIATGTAVDRNAELPKGTRGPVITLACGTGPDIKIDATTYQTSLSGSASAFAAGQPISLSLCTFAPISLKAGRHTLQTLPGRSARYRGTIGIATLTLSTGTLSTAESRPTKITSWTDEERKVQLGAGGQTVLTVHENFNSSWTATADGKRLTPIRVDGWQQAFIVPAGAATTVTIVNKPGQQFRRFLLISAVLVLLLLINAAWPARRRRRDITAPRGWGIIATRTVTLLAACGFTLLVAGPLVTAAVPLLALAVWFVRRCAPVLVIAGLGVAGGTTLAHEVVAPTSGQGAFSPLSQIAVALAVAVVILFAGVRPAPVAKPASISE